MGTRKLPENVVELFPRRPRVRDEAFWTRYLRRSPARRARITAELSRPEEDALRAAWKRLGPRRSAGEARRPAGGPRVFAEAPRLAT